MKSRNICFSCILAGLLMVGCSDGPMSFLGDGEEVQSTSNDYLTKGNPRVVATGEVGFVAGHSQSPNRPVKYRSLAFEILDATQMWPVEGGVRFTVLNEDSSLHRETTIAVNEYYREGHTVWLIGDVLTDVKYGGSGCSGDSGGCDHGDTGGTDTGGCDHGDTGGTGGSGGTGGPGDSGSGGGCDHDDTGGTDTGGCDDGDIGGSDTGGCDHSDTGGTDTGGCDHGDTGGTGGSGGMGGPGDSGSGGACDHDDTGGTDTGGCDHSDTGGTDTGGCDHGDTDTGGCSDGRSDSHGGGGGCQGGACGHSGSASRAGNVFMAKFVDGGTPARMGDLAAWKWKVMYVGASRPNITHHDNWKLCAHELIEGNLVVRDW